MGTGTLYINKVSSFGTKIYPNYFVVFSLIRTFVPQLVLWHQEQQKIIKNKNFMSRTILTQTGQWCLRDQEAFAGVCIGLRGATPRVKNANQKGGEVWSR